MKKLLEKTYRSPLGRLMSWLAALVANTQRPFMLYGYYDHSSKLFRKYTRMSSSTVIMNKKALSVGENVWVWHYSILDATEGITIGEGAQIGAWVGIFTHGSENSIRLLGQQFVNIPNTQRQGYTRGAVNIGNYTFIGAGSKILPGVTIGKGCLIGAGALVTSNIPDFSIVVGSPGKIKGSTIDFDQKFFDEHDFSETYYDSTALEMIRSRLVHK